MSRADTKKQQQGEALLLFFSSLPREGVGGWGKENNNLKVLDIVPDMLYNSIEMREVYLHKIYFYKDKNGVEPVAEYIAELSLKNDKDSRIKLNKIRDYIKALSLYGTQAGEPYMKHLSDEIWELRPLRDRILFAAYVNGGYVLLHSFIKKTQKTPAREIEKAKRELAEILERGIDHG